MTKRGKNDRRPPKLPADDPAKVAAEDQLFLEAMERLDKVPAKDRKDKTAGPERAPAAAKRSGGDAKISVDLHRLTVAEARIRVDGVLGGHLARAKAAGGSGSLTFQIITGKGRHSGSAGAVLAKDIHAHVRHKYAAAIQSIEDSPADVVVGGLPIRGHFHVTLRY